jgi:hypothetical protein
MGWCWVGVKRRVGLKARLGIRDDDDDDGGGVI